MEAGGAGRPVPPMSASDHLQPQQLAMFMPAGRIVGEHPFMEGGRTAEGKAASMANKRSDNASSRPYSRVNAPVVLAHGFEDKPVLFEGHHRITGAFDRSPNEEVPVIHIGSSREDYQTGRKQYPQSF